jgi:predicted RNase H-like HicB family nuclease
MGASESTRVRVGHYVATVAKTATGYSAHVPLLPGLGVTGATFDEAVRQIREGIHVHLEALAQDKAERPWLYTTTTRR